MKELQDLLIDQLVGKLDMDRPSAAATVLHFVFKLPHGEVGERLGLPTVEAQDLAYQGLRTLKEASAPLALDALRSASPLN